MKMNLRLKKLREKIESEKLDGFISFNPSNIFYLAGFHAENSFIFVSSKKAVLVVPKLLYPSVKEFVKDPQWQIIRQPADAEDYKNFLKQCKCRRIGLEEDVSVKKSRHIPGIKKYNNLIEDIRIIKDKSEILKIKTACKISSAAIEFAKRKIKAGLTEKELADELEYFLRKNSAEKSSFDIIVASGKNSAKPHHKPTNRKFRKNDVVLVDLGCVYRGYNSDLTKTFFLGKINTYTKKVFNIVKEAQSKAIGIIKDGIACKKVDFTARNFIERNGFGKYFIHGTGHGIGIDVHEKPSISAKSKTVLREGMTVTVEPGIYIPGRFGVRIEDTVLVTKTGCSVLTK